MPPGRLPPLMLTAAGSELVPAIPSGVTPLVEHFHLIRPLRDRAPDPPGVPGFLPSGEMEMRAARFSCGTVISRSGRTGCRGERDQAVQVCIARRRADFRGRACVCARLPLGGYCCGRRGHWHLWLRIHRGRCGDVQIRWIFLGIRYVGNGDFAHHALMNCRGSGGGR